MKPTEALQQFVDDELLRAPLLIDQVVDGAIEMLRKEAPAMSPRERSLAADLQRGLQAQRPRIVSEFARALAQAAQRELSDNPSTSPGLPSGPGALSLVDEGEVDVDVEISRAIEAIRSVAEYELRELMSYVSALVGDMDVARDYNPFRAEVMARAMWAAAQALQMAQPYQLALMRHACMPLAQIVRKSYASACARLESMGIEPAVYRTIIVFGGSRRAPLQSDSFLDPAANRTSAEVPRAPLDQVLKQAEQQLRNLPPDGDRRERELIRDLQQRQLIDSAASQVDRDLIELLAKLFDAVLGDRRLAPDVQNVVSRLQAPALRLALHDAATLDNYTHPVWLLMDRIALQGDLHPPPGDPDRARMLRFMHGLIDTLAQEQAKDADAFRWARERVLAYERHCFEQRRTAAESELHALQERDDRATGDFGVTTSHAALDVGQLDTVPAELLDELPKAAPSTAHEVAGWFEARRSGEWVRMFMQGDWVHAQLVWYGTHREYWLFADGASPRTWAVRRRALERLYTQQLLAVLQPRSLIRDAADRVLRKLTGDLRE